MSVDDQSPEAQPDRSGVDRGADAPGDGMVTRRDPELEEAWRKADAEPLGIPEEQRPEGDPGSG